MQQTMEEYQAKVQASIKRSDRMEELTQTLYDLVDKHDLGDVLLALSYVCDEHAICVRHCKEEAAWEHSQGSLSRLAKDARVQGIDHLTEEEKGA